MPNYNIVVGSKFRPFSYSELLQPVQMAETAHQELENQYSELSTKANVWENIASGQNDPYAYNMYKTYANDLANQAASLASEGLTPSSREAMLDLRNRYTSEVAPIEQAYNRRRALSDEQRKLLAQDNTLLFDRNISGTSLDEFIRNPELSYSSYSGAQLAKQVGTAAQNLRRDMRDNPRKWRGILGNQYYESLMQTGFRPEEVLAAVNGDENAPTELRSIVDDALTSSNISSWNDPAALTRAREYAAQGLWNAVGETKYETLANKGYGATPTGGGGSPSEDFSLYYRSVPKTTVAGDVDTRRLNTDLETLRGILRDPSLINKTAKRTIRSPRFVSPDPQASFVIDSGAGETREEEYYPNREILQRISERYNIPISINQENGRITGGNLQELANKLEQDIRSSAVRSFDYKPNITDSGLITQVIKENVRSFNRRSGNTGLREIKDNNRVGDYIDVDDLNSFITSDSDIGYDPEVGFVINSTDSKGKTRSAAIDIELIDDPNRSFARTINSINVALENGEDELANDLIRAMIKTAYLRFNTMVKKQGTTGK